MKADSQNICYSGALSGVEHCLTGNAPQSMLRAMELHPTPEVQAKLDELASATGRTHDAIANELLLQQLDGLLEMRATIDSRYDDIVSGRVKAIDARTMEQNIQAHLETLRHNS